MRAGIHPKYEEATVTCACGNSWQTRSTKPQIRIDLCPKCHPFYTGEQRIVDSAGQVERFMRRVEQANVAPRRKKAERRQRKFEQRQRQHRQEQQLVVGDEDESGETEE
jgi:large subunit ribosomal protein L31